MNEDEVREVVANYRTNNMPLDAVVLDIDYMERYKDFTVDEQRFPHFADFAAEMKAQGIHLVPTIDAGVKIEDGYDVYEEGVKNGYFCTNQDGTPFVAGVWPGRVHFPDMLNPEARAWFGSKYKFLLNQGIEGFWNDMNEPAIFYSEETLNNLANQKCLMFYEVTTMTDNIKVYEKLKDNFYLFNFNNILLNKILMNELKKNDKPKYIEVYSTDWKLSIKDINKYMNNGFKFIYEYIDHLSPELAGTLTLPTNITDKYNYAMSNTDVYVVVTADVLMNDVINKRGNKNIVYSSNGVDYKFFQEFSEHKLDYNFAEVFNNGKRNVCYYGALAKWFDYDLIKEIACSNKYNVILFGIKYDESYDQKHNR